MLIKSIYDGFILFTRAVNKVYLIGFKSNFINENLSKLFLKIIGWKLVGEVQKMSKSCFGLCPHIKLGLSIALATFALADLKVNYFIKKSWFFFQ